MPVVYKILFEVKLLHEYYLTREDSQVIFDRPDQPGRLAFLQEEYAKEKPPVNDDISFEFPKTMEEQYNGLYLKIIPSYSGFKVATRVMTTTLPDQSVLYTPFVPFPPELNIYVLFLRKNENIDASTNARLQRSCPSIYFFSNSDITGAKAFPFLTNPIPAQDPSLMYEQGELSLSSSNTIQEYHRQAGIQPPLDIYTDVTGSAFVNESDRLLLPEQFDYRFGNSLNLTEAEFVLKDGDGNELGSIVKNSSAGIRTTTAIDFSGKAIQLPLTEPFEFKKYTGTLEVAGNNGYTGKHLVIFSNELTVDNPWAVLNIKTTVANSAFNLFATDGFLVRRKDALGTDIPHPIFEIPVKSRLAYWRFRNNRDNELDVSTVLADYVDKEGKALVTKRPRALARDWFLLRKEASTDTVYVPNPEFTNIKAESDRRIFFELRVPQSDLFPETP